MSSKLSDTPSTGRINFSSSSSTSSDFSINAHRTGNTHTTGPRRIRSIRSEMEHKEIELSKLAVTPPHITQGAVSLLEDSSRMDRDKIRFSRKIQLIKSKEPHISDETIVRICRYVEKHQFDRDDPYRGANEECPRSFQRNPDGSIFIHFANKEDKALPDKVLPKKTGKRLTYSLDWDREILCCSYGEDDQDAAAIAECNFLRTAKLNFFNRCLAMASYSVLKGEEVLTRHRFTLVLGEKGNLKEAQPSLSRDELIKNVYETICGISELHAIGLMHRDIKRNNIVIKEDGTANIIDLDSVCKFDSSRRGEKKGITFLYVAPEVAYAILYNKSLADAMNYTHDMFSYGCMLYEIFIGKLPWDKPVDPHKKSESQARCLHELLLAISDKESWFPQPPEGSFQHLIWRLMSYNGTDRPDAYTTKQEFEKLFPNLKHILFP